MINHYYTWCAELENETVSKELIGKTDKFGGSLKQVGPLSQAIRAAACLSWGQNITAKSVHRTSLYPTALMSTNDHLSVLRHYVCT